MPPEYVDPSTGEYLFAYMTYCHTFVWDVTRAMGAEILYWLDAYGAPNDLERTEDGWELWLPAYWLGANGMNQWLRASANRSWSAPRSPLPAAVVGPGFSDEPSHDDDHVGEG